MHIQLNLSAHQDQALPPDFNERSEQNDLERALVHFDAGDLAAARQAAEAHLSQFPASIDALNLLASIATRELDHLSALALYEQAIQLAPQEARLYNNRGIAFKRLDRRVEALASYDRALAIDPDHVGAHLNRAALLQAMGHPTDALVGLGRALAVAPDDIALLMARASLWRQLERPGEAMNDFARVIELRPQEAPAYVGLAAALQSLGHEEMTVETCDRALALDADNVLAHHIRGLSLKRLGRLEEAVSAYDRAIALNPDYAEALGNRGNLLTGELDRVEEARGDLERALALMPDRPEFLFNLGCLHKDALEMDRARECFERALAADPGNARYQMNLALVCLVSGDFAAGWSHYEIRWQYEDFTSPVRDFGCPAWDGSQSVCGKRILLHSEQGYGDAIQFVRYAARVQALGAEVVLEVQPALVRLFEGLPGIRQVIARGAVPPRVDLHCPFMSLPGIFGTTVDSVPPVLAVPRLPAPASAAWRRALGERTRTRIGIVWSGSTTHCQDRRRSLTLEALLSALPEDCELVSLQKEVRDDDLATLDAHPRVRHFGDWIGDFRDTADLCAELDLVVTVDTSIAHLAATLGKPTWILLQHSPDFRWLLDRRDSPWYPSATLYRQPAPGDWASVLTQVRADLERQVR